MTLHLTPVKRVRRRLSLVLCNHPIAKQPGSWRRDCVLMRSRWVKGECGPEGKYWEPSELRTDVAEIGADDALAQSDISELASSA